MLGLSAARPLPRVASTPLKATLQGVFAEDRVKFYDAGHVAGTVNAPVYSCVSGSYEMGSLA